MNVIIRKAQNVGRSEDITRGLLCTVCAHVPQTEGKPCKLCGTTYTAARASAVRQALSVPQAPSRA